MIAIARNSRRPLAAGRHAHRSRRGIALLMVLVVLAVLILATYAFSTLMLAEHRAARVHGRRMQATALAESGVEYAVQFLRLDPTARTDAGGLYDNPDAFRGILVLEGEAAEDRGRFSVLAVGPADDGIDGPRSGLENESARLNLNTLVATDRRERGAGRRMLMALPAMTEDVAHAILDWLDTDNSTRQNGAEAADYEALDPPYAPKNGPLQTIEELLLVRGVTPELLYGPDVNCNGAVDGNETAVAAIDAGDDRGSMQQGWAAYFTLHSVEQNVGPNGKPKINLNHGDLQQLYDQLKTAIEPDWATFIVAYRQSGAYSGEEDGESVGGREIDLEQPGQTRLGSVLDLIDKKVRVRFPDAEEPTVIRSPFSSDSEAMRDYLPKLLDQVTVDARSMIRGRINVNQAPRAVLEGIPGMTEPLAAQIIDLRQPEVTAEQPSRRYAVWPLIEGAVSLEEMTKMLPFVTAGGDAYRAQVVGFFDERGPAARVEVIVDATTASPQLVSWKELSHLGPSYDPQTLGADISQ